MQTINCPICKKQEICYNLLTCKGPQVCFWCDTSYDEKCDVCIKLSSLRARLSAISAEFEALRLETSKRSQDDPGCEACTRLATHIFPLCDKIKEEAGQMTVMRHRRPPQMTAPTGDESDKEKTD